MSPTEVGFYHLTRTSLDQALPRLLEKAVEAGYRIVLRAPSEERIDLLGRTLWTYANDSFLPHGSRADGFAPEQPIFLTTEVENPNGAQVLVLVDGAPAPDLADFARVLDLFDGRDEAAVAAARQRWAALRGQDLKLVYWQQNEAGRWSAAGGTSS